MAHPDVFLLSASQDPNSELEFTALVGKFQRQAKRTSTGTAGAEGDAAPMEVEGAGEGTETGVANG